MKAKIIRQIVRLVRQAGLDYDGWRYVSRHVRRLGDLRPARKGRKLPRVLSAKEFRRFYTIVDRAEDVQHSLMLWLLFCTGVSIYQHVALDGELEAKYQGAMSAAGL